MIRKILLRLKLAKSRVSKIMPKRICLFPPQGKKINGLFMHFLSFLLMIVKCPKYESWIFHQEFIDINYYCQCNDKASTDKQWDMQFQDCVICLVFHLMTRMVFHQLKDRMYLLHNFFNKINGSIERSFNNQIRDDDVKPFINA